MTQPVFPHRPVLHPAQNFRVQRKRFVLVRHPGRRAFGVRSFPHGSGAPSACSQRSFLKPRQLF
jgi:hypothetical protein